MIDGIRNRPLNQWPFQEPKPEVPPNMAQKSGTNVPPFEEPEIPIDFIFTKRTLSR